MLGPAAVCRTSDLAEAGAFWTQDIAGTPVLVTRDAHGMIRARVNLCRHRGVRLVHEKHGVTKTFTCVLHGWTYDAEGLMGGAPLARMARDNPMLAALRDNNALTPLASELRHGFVWVAPHPRETLDLDTFLGPAHEELAARNVASFVVRARSERRIGTAALLGAIGRSAGDQVHALSDDVALVFHPRDVSLFTLARRRAETDFGESSEANAETRTLEHVLLEPSAATSPAG